jgi:putative peptidoglycan lipid II flippase
VLFSFAFSALFENIGWMPHGGLALANSLATALEVTALLIVMHTRLNGINEIYILRGGLQSAVGVLAMSVAVLVIMRLVSGGPAWLLAISGIAAGSLAYGLSMMALRVPELRLLARTIQRRLR